jgi:hypothetical protein
MDNAKCNALKEELAARPEPRIVPIERFFGGNDDLGSIGCNLVNHPGLDAFRDVFAGLLRRPDVQSIHAQIAEVDPGEGSWPFTDTVLVVGAIPAEELRDAVGALPPDEVGTAKDLGIAPSHWVVSRVAGSTWTVPPGTATLRSRLASSGACASA